ncbi:MAG: energy transducer TonB [Bacteroidota bacterium]
MQWYILLAGLLLGSVLHAQQPNPPPPPPPPPSPPHPSVDEPVHFVERMPRFPGCEDKGTEAAKKACSQQQLMKFVYDNLVYPDSAKQAGIEGVVVVQYIVERDDSVSSERIVKGLGYGCDEAALDVIRSMRAKGIKYTPGTSRGRAVRVLLSLPIHFELTPDKF